MRARVGNAMRWAGLALVVVGAVLYALAPKERA